MTTRPLGAARLFASNYQLVVCDDPSRSIADGENWDDEKLQAGFAGSLSFRMIGTEADLNDHWIELVASDRAPELDDWQRITCVHFRPLSGWLHVMSVVDETPVISTEIGRGDYSVFVAGQNLGIDQFSLGEDRRLSDFELAARKDLEWYRIFVIPGIPNQTGRIRDG